MARVYLKTYGCQMNERDSEQVVRMLIARGHEMTSDERTADVVLINTCSVRDQAEQKALGKLGMRAAADRHLPGRSHVVYGFLGCMAQSRGAELLRDAPYVDLVAGTQKFHRVAEYIDQLVAAKIHARFDDPRHAIVDVDEEDRSQSAIRDHTLKPGQASAFVSIMQGCNMSCTYCIVPHTRGRERSRPIAEIVREVRNLAERGVREVTLLGQIVNLYGRHEFPAIRGCSPFVQLLEAVHEVQGIERIRFTSPHPRGFRDDLIAAFRVLPKLCDHVHFPLQSGSDRILRAMRRTYTVAKYEDLIARLRDARPELAVTTDIIVGFPGETGEDYAMTRSAVERVQFDNAFVFRYSKRRDTPAALMQEQVPEEVKEARNQDLLSVVDRLARSKAATLVGSEVEILCEGPSKTRPDRLSGRTRQNKIVVFTGAPRHIGKLVMVRISETTGFTFYGEPVEAAVPPAKIAIADAAIAAAA